MKPLSFFLGVVQERPEDFNVTKKSRAIQQQMLLIITAKTE
jgi:hypothetical protein